MAGIVEAPPAEPVYCCYGCRFAAGVSGVGGEAGATRWLLVRLGLAIFFSMNVMVFTMALWAQDLGGAGSAPLDNTLAALFRYLALLFTLPVIWLLGEPMAANAWSNLRSGQPSIDMLLLTGVMSSLVLSIFSVVRNDGAIYLEVACGVLVLVTLGRWVEANVKLRAGEALLELEKLLPSECRRVERDREQTVPVHQIRSGDRIHLLPGERVPCDGQVAVHAAVIDEQMLTGESRPKNKGIGEPILSGSLVIDHDVWLDVSAPSVEGTAARFLALVRASLDSRGGYARIADRIAAVFLPLVVVLAIGATVVRSMMDGIGPGILAGLAVVLIACPCALGIATPLAVWAAISRAARIGVLFRTPDSLERLATVRAIRLDKTGTLTTGQASVSAIHLAENETEESVLAEAGRLARASTHPYSIALARSASHCRRSDQCSDDPVRTIPGCGVITMNTESAALGSPEFLTKSGFVWPTDLEDRRRRLLNLGRSICAYGQNKRVRAIFELTEELRPEASETLDQLRNLGLDVAILTGDQPLRAAAIASELQTPALSGQSPEGKVDAIRLARLAHGPVAFVGDGLNDAAALAASDAGIAMGCGADLTREVADICLLGNSLQGVTDAIRIARETRRAIRQNLAWALAYNVVGIGLAFTGMLNPIWAALAMVMSSVCVLGNSLRLLGTSTPRMPAPTRRDPFAEAVS